MADKIVIYIKQIGGSFVPVTARIEWLPSGKIKPLMYWTPDGTCFQVRHVYESTPMAFLKDRGEGLRFKIRAEIIETPEPDDEILHTQYETYLYFADNRFCGKNFIDERYRHAGKEYVCVTMDVFPDGGYEVIYFWVHGTRFMVEKTLTIEPRGSFQVGGVGVCHRVEARQVNADDDEDPDPAKSARRPARLFFEVNKWFVAVNHNH